MTISMSEQDWYYSDVDVGDVAILVKRENLLTGNKDYYLAPDHGGISGNLNSDVKRYHGWRGTTDNIRIEAMGLRHIIASHICKNGRVRVWISKDLFPDLECWEVETMVLYLEKCSWCFVGHSLSDETVFIGDHIGEECLILKVVTLSGDVSYRLYIDNGGACYKATRYHGCLMEDRKLIIGLGWRKIEKVYKCKNGRVKVRLSRDLKPDAE